MRCDTSGRAIVFDIGTATFGNFYAHSGTDGVSRTSRESFFGETIPNLLLNSQSSGCLGGDLNMIIDKWMLLPILKAKCLQLLSAWQNLSSGETALEPCILMLYNSPDITPVHVGRELPGLIAVITMVR